MTTILFACTHNAGRSQMAAAFFNRLAARNRATGISAGTAPGAEIHPVVLAVMREVDIDLAAERPKRLTQDLAEQANVLITMGCGDHCPFVPGLEVHDWQLTDPKDQPIERVREIRDDIRRRVSALIADRGLA